MKNKKGKCEIEVQKPIVPADYEIRKGTLLRIGNLFVRCVAVQELDDVLRLTVKEAVK